MQEAFTERQSRMLQEARRRTLASSSGLEGQLTIRGAKAQLAKAASFWLLWEMQVEVAPHSPRPGSVSLAPVSTAMRGPCSRQGTEASANVAAFHLPASRA